MSNDVSVFMPLFCRLAEAPSDAPVSRFAAQTMELFSVNYDA